MSHFRLRNILWCLSVTIVSFLFLVSFTGDSQPQYGGQLTVAIPSEPPGLDPTTNAASSIDRVLYNNVYQGLVRFNRDGEIVPCLARDWTIRNQGTAYVFQLRRGVRFHDGTKLTSKDVLVTFQRLLSEAPPIPHPEYYTSITDIQKLGTYKIKFSLSSPDSRFLYDLARGDSVIFPSGIDNPASNPVGTGPFKFTDWERGHSITLTEFEPYWNSRLPYVNEVVFRFISDPSAMISALRAGDVDVIGYGLPPEMARSLDNNSRFKVLSGLTTTEVILGINNSRKPFTKLKVRQAIAYAVDRKKLVKGVTFGYGRPIGTHMSPLNPLYIDLTWLYPHDPEKARQLLDEAGYPKGFSATLTLPSPYRYAVRAGQIIAQQLKQVGIELTLRQVNMGRWLSQVFTSANYDLTIIGHAEGFDINIYANPDYYFRYNNPRLAKVLHQALTAVDSDRRRAWYGALQWLVARDLPACFLFELPSLPAMRTEIQGWWSDYPTIACDVTEVWIASAQ